MRPSKDLIVVGIAFVLILIVIFGFIGKSLFFRLKSTDSPSLSNQSEIAKKKYPSLPAEALRLKLAKNDPIEIIDIRPKTLYTEQHIPSSQHKNANDLAGYDPEKKDAEIIIIALPDDAASMEATDTILKNKSFPYAFLDGGIDAWKSIGGNLISVGDPNSVIDRSKVSFKTAEETKALLSGPDTNLYAIIDVRESSAYKNGHIPTALNIPLDTLEEQKKSIPSGRQIITYGANDLESFRAAVRLYDLNIFAPSAIENGFASWLEKKYDVEK